MDIQKKPESKPQKQFSDLVKPSFLKSSFDIPTEKITPAREPYSLGEEELWYQPESAPVFPEVLSSTITEEPIVSSRKKEPTFTFKKPTTLFYKRLAGAFLILIIVGAAYGLMIKESLQQTVETGMTHTRAGVDSLEKKDFENARQSFIKAEESFKDARRQTLYIPTFLVKPLIVVPGVSKIASGILVVDASTHLSRAGLKGVIVMDTLISSREKVEQGEPVSYIEILSVIEAPLRDIREELASANSSLRIVPLRDIPEDQQGTFSLLQKGTPGIVGGIDSLLTNKPLLEELLGKNGPRIYLFLFQNNQELRPTGGFIGSYGILEFKNGHARRFFIDGIFNPDGQLKENIVPPKPIQKISAGWSLHDSNWFPDFPTSAEKAIFFYEKTGGPTVDGVFTLTPTVMERLLALTGPIELPEYDMVVDSHNFIPTIQEQVEIKYDKEENRPKQVLADLSSILMERVFAVTDPLVIYQLANILVEGMNEKHILLYTRNPETENLIIKNGWSGKVAESPYDYLNVIHTNVNGYKTDGVIDDSIEHHVRVEEDGSLLATTSITRTHTGGNAPYEWWNKVNSNYLRVYVPEGSKLITASGHTREFPPSPLDYQLLGFKEDAAVLAEESAIVLDDASGTRVGVEFGKTVFGNWVYVSPGEAVKVTYTYLLPFRIDPTNKETKGYSLLFQKQPGVEEVEFKSSLEYPKDWSIYWQSEDNLRESGESGIQVERTTRTDMFWGVIFDK